VCVCVCVCVCYCFGVQVKRYRNGCALVLLVLTISIWRHGTVLALKLKKIKNPSLVAKPLWVTGNLGFIGRCDGLL